jgi:hypothetical protein
VSACFPAGTRVAVEGGYKSIEDIVTGELVWSWHEETGDLALKPVRHTMQRELDALVQLRLGADVVQATPEHPFWANGGWKVAGELVVGDAVLRSDGLTMPVSEVVHHTEQPTTVYNFEVADWHTYLVSWWMFIVHNGPCEDALKWTIGTYDDLFKKAVGLPLDAHHLLQAEKMSALLKKTGQTFDHGKGISILVPTIGHTRRGQVKCISRWNGKKLAKYIDEAEKAGKSLKQISRDLLAKDIKEMRRVYNGQVPNGALQQLIEMHKKDFPQLFLK